jgi:hypothetical protein
MFALLLPILTTATVAQSPLTTVWQQKHDSLVKRLKALESKADSFGPAYIPLYKVIIPWYEAWGGRNNAPVDDWAVSPEIYAEELADALEHGHNYIAEHPDSTFPAWFKTKLRNGHEYFANYELHLPKEFPAPGRKYALTIGLPGSGWIAHKISYSRGTGNTDSWISVTPILEGRDWQIDFLNAYLDELNRILPVDRDRVYCSGHSLGAIATWRWALSNPERFAAISPDDGFGEPYRAIRLKNVPVWAIHGEKDDVILPGLAEQMISAVRDTGGTGLYSLLKDAPHNIPAWYNGQPVTDWYLRNTRSHARPPADPRNALRIGSTGFSPWSVIAVPGGMYWKSDPVQGDRVNDRGPAIASLFARAQGRSVLIDSPIRHEVDRSNHSSVLWLKVPLELQPSSKNDPSIVVLPPRNVVRFYCVGSPAMAADHLQSISKELKPGQRLSGNLWLTTLGSQSDSSRQPVYECWCALSE